MIEFDDARETLSKNNAKRSMRREFRVRSCFFVKTCLTEQKWLSTNFFARRKPISRAYFNLLPSVTSFLLWFNKCTEWIAQESPDDIYFAEQAVPDHMHHMIVEARRSCPSCGRHMPSDAANCPSCGCKWIPAARVCKAEATINFPAQQVFDVTYVPANRAPCSRSR